MLWSCKVLFKCYLFLSVRTWFCFHLRLVLYLCKSMYCTGIACGFQSGSQRQGTCLAMLQCRQVSQPMIFNAWTSSKALWFCRWAAAHGTVSQQCLGWGRSFPLASKKSSGFWYLFCWLISEPGARQKMYRYPLWFTPCNGSFELYLLRAKTFLT